MTIVPLDRIRHADHCGAHQGFVCSCDRRQLASLQQFIVASLVIAVIVILALLAAVLK